MVVRYFIVFNEDGLNKDEVRKDLKKYGTIEEEKDDVLDDGTGIWMVLMESVFSKFIRIKLDYNCVERNYILWPMKNLEEKIRLERMLAE